MDRLWAVRPTAWQLRTRSAVGTGVVVVVFLFVMAAKDFASGDSAPPASVAARAAHSACTYALSAIEVADTVGLADEELTTATGYATEAARDAPGTWGDLPGILTRYHRDWDAAPVLASGAYTGGSPGGPAPTAAQLADLDHAETALRARCAGLVDRS